MDIFVKLRNMVSNLFSAKELIIENGICVYKRNVSSNICLFGMHVCLVLVVHVLLL